jgi:hypothetical protein
MKKIATAPTLADLLVAVQQAIDLVGPDARTGGPAEEEE